ncbi:MAG: hypothetical protein RLP15_13840 [Cryomorphaceae bacterium]
MKKDELKDIFDAAFTQEAIPVDVANWDAISAALDQRSRRKAIYYWLMGLGLLFLGGISGLAVWSIAQPPAYLPGHVSSFSHLDDLPEGECLPVYNSSSDIQLPTKDADEMAEVAHVAQQESTQGSAFRALQPKSRSGSPNELQKSFPNLTSEHSHEPILPLSSSSSDQVGSASIDDSPIATEARIEDLLEKMPLRHEHLAAEIKALSTRHPDTIDHERPWVAYIRAGVALNTSSEPGQVGGIGVSAHLLDNLLFGTELLLVRDFVNLESVIDGQTYGYEAYQQSILIQASEILSTELPVFVRYRWNRFSLGGGLSASYVIGARLTERHSLRSSKTQQPWTSDELTEVVDVGYVRWKAVNPFRLSATTDLSYQLTERYYVGSRISYPLQDVFTSNTVNDRFIRLEFYLKMSLKP